ncbi:hypothetical protein B4U79_07773 [Dinothrombium tinctorium]|uniref:N-alpha-acetyltransferase 60 n=1 Tax=Dinothrombium tinctorium TaxID=1965070 RepID=A0A3S3SFR8_9ACAR|nr:hypothetical protein B4U79_12810 [Dinothrombium tinctorium]RWS14191.1 hypothetical protein B4U79_00802 [Dinothrombium tinctorium]RWS14704.1 hypothetical protein B4U79_07773 [Dinothrombium tinctorium]
MTKVCVDSSGNRVPVELRFLRPDDVPTVRQLCKEWFPIAYPNTWYEDITSNPRFYALAATLHVQIVGLIVAEIKQQLKCNVEDQGLLSKQFSKLTPVAYILTLGVVKEYRRNGIATLLLDNLIDHLTNTAKDTKAVYLHVLTTNIVAIRFYEKRQFRKHLCLPLYYYIDGEGWKDGYSYVLYINGGQPPWILIYPFLFRMISFKLLPFKNFLIFLNASSLITYLPFTMSLETLIRGNGLRDSCKD